MVRKRLWPHAPPSRLTNTSPPQRRRCARAAVGRAHAVGQRGPPGRAGAVRCARARAVIPSERRGVRGTLRVRALRARVARSCTALCAPRSGYGAPGGGQGQQQSSMQAQLQQQQQQAQQQAQTMYGYGVYGASPSYGVRPFSLPAPRPRPEAGVPAAFAAPAAGPPAGPRPSYSQAAQAGGGGRGMPPAADAYMRRAFVVSGARRGGALRRGRGGHAARRADAHPRYAAAIRQVRASGTGASLPRRACSHGRAGGAADHQRRAGVGRAVEC